VPPRLRSAILTHDAGTWFRYRSVSVRDLRHSLVLSRMSRLPPRSANRGDRPRGDGRKARAAFL